MFEGSGRGLTGLQGVIAVASFSMGVLIAVVCLFFVEPYGEITNSAIYIVSELLVLCGAILGVKASYDEKFCRFEAQLRRVTDSGNRPERQRNDNLGPT